jgi:hypothetical protein
MQLQKGDSYARPIHWPIDIVHLSHGYLTTALPNFPVMAFLVVIQYRYCSDKKSAFVVNDINR